MISIRLMLDRVAEYGMIHELLNEWNQYGKEILFQYELCNTQNLMSEVMQEGVNLLMIDLQYCDRELDTLREIRRRNPQLELVVLSDDQNMACRCMDPDIRPLCFLKKPLKKSLLCKKFGRMYRYLLEKNPPEEKDGLFLFGKKRLQRRIPYSRILYFETRNKKVILHGLYDEYEFYDSFSSMEQLLPEYFIRCHRSYIVNACFITGLDLPGRYMLLEGDKRIPVSKRYCGQMKGIL